MVQSTLARVGTHWKPIALVAAGALLISGGVVAVAESRSKDAGREALADASRVLQSVNVKLAPNGDLTGIKGNVVGTTTADKAFSFSEDYQPDSTAKDLPVRVLTSYRTAKKSGTDLSELDGYDGRVDITVTVQNLTVKPKQVTYDVDGEQRSQSALVGVPLTVVASTALADTKPSAVVTKGAKKGTVTNGVLSQDQDGNTQVQWATILAPPQLASSTTMTLAVDAKDFKVPDFDLSVQPGLVTDPSVGALLNSAFNPAGNSQMQLEQRTIALIAELNAVLAKAGKSMATVRKTLGESSKTLGTKTVSDLQQSTKSIASSVKGLKGSVTQLGGDISGSLKSTQSQTLSELNGLVSSVNGLLGDTNIEVPPAEVTPNGCATAVKAPTGATSFYARLLQVVSLLNGYADATEQCKLDVQTTITNIVGPEKPDADTCATPQQSVSVTCALYETKDSLATYAGDLAGARDSALNTLNSLGVTSLTDALRGTLTPATDDGDARENGLQQAATALRNAALASGGKPDVSGIQNALNAANNAYGNLGIVINGIHQQALAGQDGANTMTETNNALADQICDLPDRSQANNLIRYVSTIDCDGNQINGNNPLQSQIAAQRTLWDSVVTSTDTGAASPTGLAKAFADLRSALDALQTEVTAVANSGGVGDVITKAGIFDAAFNNVLGRASTVENNTTSVHDGIESSFNKAINGLKGSDPADPDDIPSELDNKIRLVYARGQSNNTDLGNLFTGTATGFKAAGTAIQEDGKKAVNQQKGAFAAQKNQSAARISAAISAGLKQVDKGVNASTRDLQGAQTLLIGDLRNVLLDLGTRKVKGSGLLGAMATSAATTGSANYQVALASRTASAYSNVRQSDIVGLLLRQAQTDASQQAQANLPAFGLDLPSSADHETVYSFHLDSAG